jgi:hypothetical protein
MNSIDEFLEKEYQSLVKKTGEELPEDTCYCGQDWMPKFIRCLLSHKFNASCKVHDIYYMTSCIDNEDADVIFLDHMLMQAGESLVWRSVAYLMFIKVRVFQFFNRDFFSSFKT